MYMCQPLQKITNAEAECSTLLLYFPVLGRSCWPFVIAAICLGESLKPSRQIFETAAQEILITYWCRCVVQLPTNDTDGFFLIWNDINEMFIINELQIQDAEVFSYNFGLDVVFVTAKQIHFSSDFLYSDVVIRLKGC